jgi:hypothetical protein
MLPKEFPDLLAEEYVLAQAERALCASGALAGRDARWGTIPLEFDGIRAGKTSRGHRILAPTAA